MIKIEKVAKILAKSGKSLLKNTGNFTVAMTFIFNLSSINLASVVGLMAYADNEPAIDTINIENSINQTSLVGNSGITTAKKKSLTVYVTAYSSTPDQTDDTPFITASGETVSDGIIAANFLPFGTHIQIPKLFGAKIFTVEDRMHKRFNNRVDIWFPDRASAVDFGIKKAEIVIL